MGVNLVIGIFGIQLLILEPYVNFETIGQALLSYYISKWEHTKYRQKYTQCICSLTILASDSSPLTSHFRAIIT